MTYMIMIIQKHINLSLILTQINLSKIIISKLLVKILKILTRKKHLESKKTNRFFYVEFDNPKFIKYPVPIRLDPTRNYINNYFI